MVFLHPWRAQCILILDFSLTLSFIVFLHRALNAFWFGENIVPPPRPLCMYGIQHHYCIGIVCIIAFPERSQSSFLFDETKVGFKSRCKINFQQSTSPVVLKTRTFRLATKLRQKFNRFSPFRKLTSFVTSFTAYVIYAASPDTYNKSGEDNFISLKSFLDKKKTWRSDNEDENWCLGKREGSAV